MIIRVTDAMNNVATAVAEIKKTLRLTRTQKLSTTDFGSSNSSMRILKFAVGSWQFELLGLARLDGRAGEQPDEVDGHRGAAVLGRLEMRPRDSASTMSCTWLGLGFAVEHLDVLDVALRSSPSPRAGP